MKLLLACLLFALSPTLLAQRAAPLSDAEVEQAIAEGTRAKKLSKTMYLTPKFGQGFHFAVTASGPYERVVAAAWGAKRQYLSFGLKDVTDRMRSADLVIAATPPTPKAGYTAISVKRVVIQPKGQKGLTQTIEPFEIATVPMSWSNAMGGQWEASGLISRFDPATLPAGDLEVVMITDSLKEYRMPLDKKKRAKLR